MVTEGLKRNDCHGPLFSITKGFQDGVKNYDVIKVYFYQIFIGPFRLNTSEFAKPVKSALNRLVIERPEVSQSLRTKTKSE